MNITLTANTDWYLHNFRLDLARAARIAGHEVSMVCPDGPYVPKLREEGFRVETFVAPADGFSLGGNRKALGGIVAAYRTLQPDLVHLFTPVCVLLGAIAARRLRVPYRVAALTGLGHVFTSDSLKAQVVRPAMRWVFRRELTRPGVAVVFQNEGDMIEMVDTGVVDPGSCFLIRGSGVDIERFRPRDVSAETSSGATDSKSGTTNVEGSRTAEGDTSPQPEPGEGGEGGERAPEPIVILFASRLLKEKGLIELLEAFRRVRRAHPHAELWIAGEPYAPNPTSLGEREVAALKRAPGVRLLGHVEDMPGLLAQADIVALPSYREGTPKILLEAAACGLPIVATDIAGCQGVVEEGASGFLVPVQTIDPLADRLSELVADAPLRARFGRQARRIAVEGFSMDRVVAETLDVYAQITKTPQPVG